MLLSIKRSCSDSVIKRVSVGHGSRLCHEHWQSWFKFFQYVFIVLDCLEVIINRGLLQILQWGYLDFLPTSKDAQVEIMTSFILKKFVCRPVIACTARNTKSTLYSVISVFQLLPLKWIMMMIMSCVKFHHIQDSFV